MNDLNSVLTTRLIEEILDKRGEHVPRLKMHKRADEVKAISCSQRDDYITEGSVGFHKATRVFNIGLADEAFSRLTARNLSSPRQCAGQ